MGNTVVASAPNEVLLVDFLKVYHPRPTSGMGVTVTSPLPYVLVMRDAFSLYTSLHAAEGATARCAADGLLQWAASFGVPKVVRSDHGSHFDNALHAIVGDSLNMESAYSVPRYPQSNGRAERAVQSVVSALRSSISEAQVAHEHYYKLLPFVMLTMNSAESAALGGISPFEAFLGRKPRAPLERFVLWNEDDGSPYRTVEVTGSLRDKVQEFSHEMRKLVERTFGIHERKNEEARARFNRRRNLDPLTLQLGDFVVYRWFSKTASKMAHKWLGPARIVRLLSGSVFEVEDLLTGKRREVAAPHVAFYSNALLEDEMKEIKRTMAYERYAHQVGSLNSLVMGEDGSLQVVVRFRGFQEDDPTGAGLEPLKPLYKHLPRTVVRFLRRLHDEGQVDLVQSALAELGETNAILSL